MEMNKMVGRFGNGGKEMKKKVDEERRKEKMRRKVRKRHQLP